MVSMVRCQRHPEAAQSGILACSHVSTISSDAVPVSEAQPLRVILDDSKFVTRLVVLACSDCCSTFKLRSDQPVSADTFWDESNFPYVAPICLRCATDDGYVSPYDKDAV